MGQAGLQMYSSLHVPSGQNGEEESKLPMLTSDAFADEARGSVLLSWDSWLSSRKVRSKIHSCRFLARRQEGTA